MTMFYVIDTVAHCLGLCHLDAILSFLYDHISQGVENQARVKWAPNTVVLWDNRITAHVCQCLLAVLFVASNTMLLQSAIVDFKELKERRHGARITPQAERPIPALDGLDLSANHCQT